MPSREPNTPPPAPYISPTESPAEATAKAVGAGILFGILFGAANAYLGLRAGLTISTSIPVAVMTVALFRTLRVGGVRSSVLEANLSQTVGSASSSVASGVIFTLPALFLWGFDTSFIQITILAMSGGLLGVLFMIPLRPYLIVREHDTLPYPEGTACAEVLKASQAGGARARLVFLGLGIGALLKGMTGWIRAVPDALQVGVPFLKKAQLGSDVSAALPGVGYILGPRIATVMVGGSLLSWMVIIPILATWGTGRPAPLYPETVLPLDDMAPDLLWTRYIRYIGAGAVAMAGVLTLLRSVPLMVESFRFGAQQLRERLAAEPGVPTLPRTELDLPLRVVGVGAVAIFAVLALVPLAFSSIEIAMGRAVAALLVVVFAFFFVTVSSRIVGLVGVTANPTSGMTIATLLGTSSIFLLLGWTNDGGKVAALTVGAVVAIAASIAGDTSQDLKTGFLLGATPRRQQIGELVGVLTSAAFVAITVLLLARAYGFGGEELPAPQAMLMRLVIDGVLARSLPWTLVAIGAGIAIVIELCRIPSLPFAVGVYLPVSTMLPVFLGGLLRLGLERQATTDAERLTRRDRGVLLGSGLVGGEGLIGVVIAGAAGWAVSRGQTPWSFGYAWAGAAADWLALSLYVALLVFFWRGVVRTNRPG
ncbi:MAG: oligopeptide transporter, OPT family [Vicinamibacterales bacterium]|jgi:putative OPT family oligopeptide transporter|nr:oligopeptide transporter, OPT family [Vicinamibacterales bacterium]